MKFEATFLRSKVALRIFVLFICCALLPTGVLAILSFTHVTKELNKQSQRRRHQASKDMGRAVYERLLFLEDEMKVIASKFGARANPVLETLPEDFGKHLQQRFEGLAIVTGTKKARLLFGLIQNIPELLAEQSQHIRSGGTLVTSDHHPDLSSHILMAMALDPKNLGRGFLWGEINPAYLWGSSIDNPLPAMTKVCILDHSNHMLFSSFPGPVSFPEEVRLKMARSTLGQFVWIHEKEEYLANYWSIFLKAAFFTSKWTVVLSESKSHVLAPISDFRKIFPLVVFMSLLVVLLVSIIQIRRSLVPLERLHEGTQRVAAKDFDSRVTIKSGDEFEELAASFNTMAGQLGKQFKTLTTMGEIDRAILSSLETEKIVEVVITRMSDVFPCDCVSVTLLDSGAGFPAQTYIGGGKPETINLTPDEAEEIRSSPEGSIIEADAVPPNYLAPLASRGAKSFLILRLILKQSLLGIITLGYLKPPVHSEEDLARARQLADQIAVALSNARLIRELNQLNWGMLTAFARAIDAKSPWTAGHSERVTRLGLKIAEILGFTEDESDVLRRAGLLHDIGKIGVPADILDKAGDLTKEEERFMREHARLGARILEPLEAYAEVIPIVLQHHECFDGSGYPYGLAGRDHQFGRSHLCCG